MANPDGMPQTAPSEAADTPDDIIAEAKQRFQTCLESEDRDDAMEDLLFLKGGDYQWDSEAVRQRELDNRPCLTFNNIPAIIHQVTNDVRQNKQSVQVAPVDDGADVKVAKVIEGLIRHIEYDSGADAAYDTALEGAARIGFGFFRLVTQYCSPFSFDQEIKIKRIRNPFTVHVDPNAQEADSHDMQFAFISTKMARDEFERTYPDASATTQAIGTAIGDHDNWLWTDYVRVSEYYRIEYKKERLILLPDGKTTLASDPAYKAALKAGTMLAPIVERETQVPKVMWYKLTAVEILEQQEIPCQWIPVFPVYGDEIDEDGEVTRSGIIRNAKAPKVMENYWLTSATEEIAMRTKTPFIGAMGQFEGVEQDWNAANVRNFSYLEYNPVSIEGTLAPKPERQAPADVPAGYIQMAGIARDAVKAVTGIYDASLGHRSNETSGVAIRERQQQGDIANFHFTDNLTRAITRMAKCIIDMIPRIYDTERVVRVLGEDRKSAEPVKINSPTTKQDENGQAIQTVLNDLTVGTYDVTVSTGPAYNTMRQEAAANMIELGAKWPKLMDIAGDKVVRAMDWPGADDIAERIERTLPPGLVDKGDEENMVQTPKGPIPAQQAGQLIGQLDDTIQKMQAEMEDLQSGVTKAKIDAESRETVAHINAAAKHDDTELSGMVQLLVANQSAMADRFAAFADSMLAMNSEAGKAMIAHGAAVDAAGDPDHPAPPAPIAQGMEVSPAAAEMAEPEPGAGTAPASTGASQ